MDKNYKPDSYDVITAYNVLLFYDLKHKPFDNAMANTRRRCAENQKNSPKIKIKT